MKTINIPLRFFFLYCIIIGSIECGHRTTNDISNWQSYNERDLVIEQKDNKSSKGLYKYRDINFVITHEDNLNISGYKIGILVNRLVYIGKFEKNIFVENIPILNTQNPLEDYVTLSIWLIDENKKRLAVFTEKNPFFIKNANRITFLLKSSFDDGYGNCKITIDEKN